MASKEQLMELTGNVHIVLSSPLKGKNYYNWFVHQYDKKYQARGATALFSRYSENVTSTLFLTGMFDAGRLVTRKTTFFIRKCIRKE